MHYEALEFCGLSAPLRVTPRLTRKRGTRYKASALQKQYILGPVSNLVLGNCHLLAEVSALG